VKITVSVASAYAGIGGLLVAAVSVFATDAAAFESDIWAGTLPSSSAAFSVQSRNAVEGSPYTVEGWVVVNYATSVNCSPPRACYASSQWVYAYAYCASGGIREMKRVSLDLNGTAVAESGERMAYIPPHGSVDRAVVRSLCGRFALRRTWRDRDGDSDTDD